MTFTVFCGSRFGKNGKYEEIAKEFALTLAKRGHSLVYGGGSVGLMGVISKVAYKNGANVVGVIPELLQEKEEASYNVSKLMIVESMHARKSIMHEMADAYVVLPGGIGTMEEVFEAWTWSQLGYHKKKVVFLDIDGYYSKLFDFIDEMVESDFLEKRHREIITIFTDINLLFNYLEKL